MQNIKSLIILIIFLGSIKLSGEFVYTGYPYIAYSNETRLMAGGFFYVGSKEDPELSLLGNAIYTQNKQFLAVLLPEYYDPDLKLRYSSEAYLKLWPDTFYGSGNFTDGDISEPFTSEMYVNTFTLSKEFWPKVFVSLLSAQGYHRIVKSVDHGMLETSDLDGKEDSFYSGIGYRLRYDTTDNQNYPTRGVRYSIGHIIYREELLSDYDFTEHRYDFRHYLSINPRIVLASQTDLAINSGDAPYYSYLELGNRLRAYDSKRFIDKARIAQRLEQRITPFSNGASSRLGFVTFVETGQVMPTWDKIRLTDWHWSVGFGLRFSILPQERLNLRMDFGFGDDSINFIVNAREVF